MYEIYEEGLNNNFFETEHPSRELLMKLQMVDREHLHHNIPEQDWKKAIIGMSAIYRELCANRGGVVKIDCAAKTMTYQNN